MAGRLMLIQEIKRRFKGEWLLLSDCETDRLSNIKRAKVIFHSPDRQAVFRELSKKPCGRKTASIYVGEIPKDLAVML